MADYCMMGEGLGDELTSGGFLALANTITQHFPRLNVRTFGGDMDAVVDLLTSLPTGDRVIIGGYSRGADYAPTIAKRIVRPVVYLFQFQPSIYYFSDPVTSNVKKAFCVYNPWWVETFGLGFRRSYKEEGNEVTDMEVVMAHDSHGGVQYNPAYQSRVIRDIGEALGG